MSCSCLEKALAGTGDGADGTSSASSSTQGQGGLSGLFCQRCLMFWIAIAIGFLALISMSRRSRVQIAR